MTQLKMTKESPQTRRKQTRKKGKKSSRNKDVLDNSQVVKIWEVINTLKMSVISLTE